MRMTEVTLDLPWVSVPDEPDWLNQTVISMHSHLQGLENLVSVCLFPLRLLFLCFFDFLNLHLGWSGSTWMQMKVVSSAEPLFLMALKIIHSLPACLWFGPNLSWSATAASGCQWFQLSTIYATLVWYVFGLSLYKMWIWGDLRLALVYRFCLRK